jgi:protein SCO1/2
MSRFHLSRPAQVARMLLGRVAFFFFATAILFAQTQRQIAAHASLEQKLNAQVPLDSIFRDEHDHEVSLRSFVNTKPVILVLAYYECPNLCTLVLNGILQTAQDLKFDAGKKYEIVIISFDPRERAALAAAKKQIYVQHYGRVGGDEGWHFLTGTRSAIEQVTNSVGYYFAYDEATRQFAHPSVAIVLTPAGKVSRYFPGIEYPAREVRLALIEASQERIGTVADRVFLLCFHYNPATGKYGLLISRLMQVAGIGTAAILALYVILNVWRDRFSSP